MILHQTLSLVFGVVCFLLGLCSGEREVVRDRHRGRSVRQSHGESSALPGTRKKFASHELLVQCINLFETRLV